MPELYDTHCHILPGIDDGCRTPEEALAVLAECRRQGVEHLVLTPHYGSRRTVDEFLADRAGALQSLQRTADEAGFVLPELRLGAEVAWHPGLIHQPRLPELCCEGTRYLLLELPCGQWSANLLREVEQLPLLHGVTPVLAHLERFRHQTDRASFRAMLELGFPVQVNAEFFFSAGFTARRWLRQGRITFLGSDCHGPVHRPPNLGPLAAHLAQKRLTPELTEIMANARVLFPGP